MKKGGSKRLLLSLAGVFLSLLTGLSFSQAAEADTLFAQAKADAQAARDTYAGPLFTVDQRLWRSALEQAHGALELDPDNPEIILFLAETYGAVRWYIRAWEQWLAYLELGGELATSAHAAQFAETGNELGFARYEANDLSGALPYYQKVTEVLPENIEALTWLGRIHLEQGDTETALSYWQRLVALEPDSAGFAYYRDLSEEQLEVGAAASASFRAGLQAYEAGQLGDALSAFEAALDENDAFLQAYVWAGRTSLELGQPAKAERYWREVLSLDPEDERARYFAERAAAETQWGTAAATAFYEGQQLYAEGEVSDAAERFDTAALLNPAFKDALVWAARSYQEAENADKAIRYWQAVLALDPNDTRAAYFLELARQEQVYGGKAGRAFALGVEQFEGANLDAAEALFQEAVDANPEFGEAWAWLGRIYFTLEDYAEAQDAYERALDLEPANSDYRFFANEAAFLADESGESSDP